MREWIKARGILCPARAVKVSRLCTASSGFSRLGLMGNNGGFFK